MSQRDSSTFVILIVAVIMGLPSPRQFLLAVVDIDTLLRWIT